MAETKILIVDDEPDNITFVGTILKKEGFTVLSASDGLEGINRAVEESPDLIVLDVQMPKMNGFEVFDKLRKEGSTKQIPVVMLTGIREKVGIGFNAEDMKKFYGEEPNGYVEKPISPEELVKVIKENLL
jgi:CheY-like chemotaxis protein